jgi:hypothetical protein
VEKPQLRTARIRHAPREGRRKAHEEENTRQVCQ